MHSEKSKIEHIVELLKNGGIVAAPTDTVYGLLADATNEEAVAKIITIKGREEGKGMPIFIDSLEHAKEIAMIDNRQEEILSQLWPGKITAILELKKSANMAKNALNDDGTIALRVPSHQLLLEILQKTKKPLIGTSANKSGMASCANTRCVKDQLSERLLDMVIEGGELTENESSTIIDLTKFHFTVIRKGADFKKLQKLFYSNLGRP